MGNGQSGGEAQPQTHNETIRKTVASYSYQRSVMEVHQEFSQLDPAAISDACRAWKRAADELTALADDLRSQAADKLHAAWSAPSSPDAQKQLQYSEATARALANDCLQMAHSTDYAAQYATWYKDNLPSYTDSLATAAKGLVQGDGLTAGADAATQHLVNFLSRYNEVISTLPNSVQDSLVASKPISRIDDWGKTDGSTSGVTGTYTGHGGGGPTPPKVTTGPDKPLKPITDPFGGPGGNGPGGTGTGSNGTGSTGIGSGASGTGTGTSGLGSGIGGSGTGTSGIGSGVGAGVGAGDPYAAGSSLAGTGLGGGLSSFDPSALGSGASGVAGGGGLGSGLSSGLGAAGLGAGGLGAGVGASRAGSGLGGRLAGLGSGGLGSGASGTPGAIGAGGLGSGGIGSRAGGGLEAERAGSYGRGGAGALAGEGGAMGGTGRGTGGNMMPMHGAGHGGEGEEERQRSTWLTEDDDLWGSGGDVPPPVITS